MIELPAKCWENYVHHYLHNYKNGFFDIADLEIHFLNEWNGQFVIQDEYVFSIDFDSREDEVAFLLRWA